MRNIIKDKKSLHNEKKFNVLGRCNNYKLVYTYNK